jgi:hypothetical protein
LVLLSFQAELAAQLVGQQWEPAAAGPQGRGALAALAASHLPLHQQAAAAAALVQAYLALELRAALVHRLRAALAQMARAAQVGAQALRLQRRPLQARQEPAAVVGLVLVITLVLETARTAAIVRSGRKHQIAPWRGRAGAVEVEPPPAV